MSDNVALIIALVLSLGILLASWCHANDINKRLDRIAAALERAYPVQAEAK